MSYARGKSKACRIDRPWMLLIVDVHGTMLSMQTLALRQITINKGYAHAVSDNLILGTMQVLCFDMAVRSM